MRRATLATTSIKTNKGKSVGKEVRPRSSFGVGPRTSGAGVRPKTSFGSTRFVNVLSIVHCSTLQNSVFTAPV